MSWELDPNRNHLDMDYFISRSANNPVDTNELRRRLALLFDRVDRNVKCLHTASCGHHLAEAFLKTINVPGPVVECGTFKGGMAAKLSILCKVFNKKLFVFDSFKGLPHSEPCTDMLTGEFASWEKGWFTGHRSEVENSIKYYGYEEVTTLVEGWFEDTLHLHDIKPSLIFIDVDLVSSMRTCLEYFWPRLRGPYFFSHEATVKEYAEAILDEDWWRQKFNCSPPSHVGVGAGYPDAGHLCRLNKEF
jgi:O-methyltransferase